MAVIPRAADHSAGQGSAGASCLRSETLGRVPRSGGRRRAADPGAARPAGRAGAGRDRGQRSLGLPRSTTYRLLGALVEQGFVSYLPEERRYGLGVVTFELGSSYSRQMPLRRIAQPVLSRLVGTARQNAHLAVLHGPDVYYVIEERAPGRPPLVTDVGVRLPATLTASGLAILARSRPPSSGPSSRLRRAWCSATAAGRHPRASCGRCSPTSAGAATPWRTAWSPPVSPRWACRCWTTPATRWPGSR